MQYPILFFCLVTIAFACSTLLLLHKRLPQAQHYLKTHWLATADMARPYKALPLPPPLPPPTESPPQPQKPVAPQSAGKRPMPTQPATKPVLRPAPLQRISSTSKSLPKPQPPLTEEQVQTILPILLRQLRDANNGEDFFDSFSLSGNTIVFQHRNLTRLAAEGLVSILQQTCRKQGWEMRWLDKPDFSIGPSCRFSFQLAGRLDSKQLTPAALDLIKKDLSEKAETVGREMFERQSSPANEDPLSWQTIPQPETASVILAVWPNHDLKYPNLELGYDVRGEIEDILKDFPQLHLRLARLWQAQKRVCILIDLTHGGV